MLEVAYFQGKTWDKSLGTRGELWRHRLCEGIAPRKPLVTLWGLSCIPFLWTKLKNVWKQEFYSTSSEDDAELSLESSEDDDTAIPGEIVAYQDEPLANSDDNDGESIAEDSMWWLFTIDLT